MAFGRKHAVVSQEEASRYVKYEKKKGALAKSLRTQKEIWIISLLALIWVIIFNYVPMAGNIIAFYQWFPARVLPTASLSVWTTLPGFSSSLLSGRLCAILW